MAVELNHTIVACPDKTAGARWVAELLGLAEPKPFGPFMVVELSNDLSMDFASTDQEIAPQHYAFLVSEPEFDQIFGRMTTQQVNYWADPMGSRPQEINTNDGGRGCYFQGPGGHWLEILTRPYGSGSG